jgi:hypothetical protein
MNIKRGDRINFGTGRAPEYLTVHSILEDLALVAWDDGVMFVLRVDILRRPSRPALALVP